MKKTKRLLPIILTIAMGITAAFALTACDESYTTTETDNLIAELQATIDGNKSELDEKITALTEEYKAKDSELLTQITANQQAIDAMQTEYAAKIAELELADETNAKAINDLKAEYLAKVEELANANTDNANTLAELKSTYESKVAALEKADSDNKKAIDDLTAEYTAQVESLIAADSKNATALSELKTAYESKVAELTQADETNKKAIADLTSEYTAKIEELAKADSDNATALAELKTAYENKVKDLIQADEDNAQAIGELEKEYLAKVEELVASDTANANALTLFKAEYEGKIAELTEAIEINKASLEALALDYLEQLEVLGKADSDNATALAELKSTYESKIATLEKADSDNKKALDDLETAYLAQVENLVAADNANAGALADFKITYQTKMTALEKTDNENKQAIATLTSEYQTKVATLENKISQANETIASNKTALETSIASLKATYETKVDELETLITEIQNTDKSQAEKIAELERKVAELLTVKTYTVTFDSDGGSAVALQTIEKGEKAMRPIEPTKAGYTFDGWYIDGEKWSFVGYTVTEDITLTAEWTANLNTLTFNANGATDGEMSDINAYTAEMVTIPECAYVKTAYTFIGWATSVDGEVVYEPGENYIMGTDSIATLYAVWSDTDYNITYVLNGGVNGENPTTYSVEDNITFANATRTAYYFKGWYLDEDHQTPKTEIVAGEYGAITLYAKWEAIEYTITYVLNGGVNVDDNPAVYTTENSVTLNTPTREYYDFVEWQIDGQGVTEIAKGTYGNITLRATWKPTVYAITYELDGGNNHKDNPNGYTIETATFSLQAPSKTGYTFDGWYTESEFENAVTEITKGSTGKKTIYAKWRKVVYEIAYELNGGDNHEENPNEYTIETATITLHSPTRTGYTFAGWYTDSGFNNKVTALPFGSYGDKKYYAKWNPIAYTITYELDGGKNNEDNPQEYTIESRIALYEPKKPYCSFDGWYTENTFENEITEIPLGWYGEKTLYAKWIDGPNAIVYFDGNGATNIEKDFEQGNVGDTLTLPLNRYVRQDYTFIGWSDTVDGEVLYEDEATYTFGETGETTLYAVWKQKTESGLGWIIKEDNTVEITYISGAAIVSIPDCIAGYNVTSIASAGYKNGRLTHITIPSSVISIATGAFAGCSNLTSVTIGNGVKSIGAGAFSGCGALTEITLPFVGAKAGVTINDIYQYPFGYIFGTSSYTGSTATRQYYYGSSTSSTTYETYYIPTSLKTVTITGGNILYGAFYNCSNLTSIVIGDSVTSIGDYAFYNCSNLTSVVIGDSVTSIGDYAFYNCSNLTSVVIGDSVTSIGSYAFAGCGGLTSVVIGDSVTSIGEWVFSGCCALTNITIPDNATSIGDAAFNSCDSLTSVVLGNGLTSIANALFAGCSSLKSVTIGKGVTSIGNSAFVGCKNLTSIVIPDGVTSIGNSAFDRCSNLTSIVIPESVTSIELGAFLQCYALGKVYYEGTSNDWSKIYINGIGTDDLTTATRYYYSEYRPTTSGNYWYFDKNGNIVIW